MSRLCRVLTLTLVDMIDMFVSRTPKYDDIVQIDNGKVPLHFSQQDNHCSLKRPWRILQSEGHASETEKTMMACKGGFISIFFGNFDLLISAISVKCRKHRWVARRIDKFVHARYLVRVPDRHCVQPTVVDAKAKSYVLLFDKENR